MPKVTSPKKKQDGRIEDLKKFLKKKQQQRIEGLHFLSRKYRKTPVHKAISCPHCKVICNSLKQLQNHMKSKHIKNKSLLCQPVKKTKKKKSNNAKSWNRYKEIEKQAVLERKKENNKKAAQLFIKAANARLKHCKKFCNGIEDEGHKKYRIQLLNLANKLM